MNTSTGTTSVSQRISSFLFGEDVPYGFALMRILLPLVLLETVLSRWRFCEELFSTNGVNVSLCENFGSYNYFQPLPPFWAACVMSILVLSLLTMMLGWFTRLSVITSLILHTYFVCNDMAATTTKFTVIETHLLLLLSMSGCGRIWSIDSWLAGRRDPGRAPLSERPAWATSPRWPQVLLFVMIGASYLGAAITKLHMPDFITGDAISYWIMSNPNYRHPIGERMTQYPGLLVISGHFTVLWEILFSFLGWRGAGRKYMFALGLFFHFMAALTLGEITFLWVMSTCYLGCIKEDEAQSLGGWLSRWLRIRLPLRPSQSAVINRLPILSPRLHGALLTCLVLTFGLGGGWLNQRLDLYGIHRPEGLYELQPIEPEEVARLFTPAPPLRESDKYMGVKLGTLKVGGRLSNHCDQFRYNDVLVCEASLNPPHEDMWIECHFLNEEQKTVHRDGVVVPREARWAQFTYTLTDVLAAGEYTLVIRSRGQEICRRPFTLAMGAKAPVAN